MLIGFNNITASDAFCSFFRGFAPFPMTNMLLVTM